MNILLVEDEARISDFLVRGLKEYGYNVILAQTGEAARDYIDNENFDIILMDILLPELNGIQLIEIIRFKKKLTPVLVLSALSSTEDKINMLNLGADDYLTKPFHFEELISRIRALIRRKNMNYQDNNDILTIFNLSINTLLHTVIQNDIEIELSPKEYDLLLYLLENKNKVMSRTQILKRVWGLDFDPGSNVVDVYISYIRSKLDESEKKIIYTIKGKGYLIKD
ncbi:response regulator transcription factor [Elizabethkingia anophelis]|uniref:response regulator transcription factor n=1 Tax=Elizabethkingia anophelis TaxID=1117645 RepID=UPI00136D00C5|nr:response regulator transcription factor [Elizabethkingia anophelis]MYY27372.1 DNA-binding response regulator [Elizabethkingia anophelis]